VAAQAAEETFAPFGSSQVELALLEATSYCLLLLLLLSLMLSLLLWPSVADQEQQQQARQRS
jgi:membrane protein implicated in regulation of membrane protease activity